MRGPCVIKMRETRYRKGLRGRRRGRRRSFGVSNPDRCPCPRVGQRAAATLGRRPPAGLSLLPVPTSPDTATGNRCAVEICLSSLSLHCHCLPVQMNVQQFKKCSPRMVFSCYATLAHARGCHVSRCIVTHPELPFFITLPF